MTQDGQYLPTPWGRSVVPWRELEPMPQGDSRLPAKDKLKQRTNEGAENGKVS